MMRQHVFILLVLTTTRVLADDGPITFGSVEHSPITWETPSNVELTSKALRFTTPGATARSQQLPLKPQHYYRITAKMARGPGATPHFSITYLSAHGKPIEWTPGWQLKSTAHPGWLPLSPSPQRYIQGFVLPPGATQPRLHLRLDPGDKALGAHGRWELTELSITALHAAPSCKKLADNRLLGGDFEGTPVDDMPAFWNQASRTDQNRVELVAEKDAHRHVLRVKPNTHAFLASSYLVPVARGSAYQIKLLARGHGRIDLDIHSLNSDRPVPLRVGNTTHGAGSFNLNSDTWTELSRDWFAEAPNIATAQAFIAVTAQSAVDIDAVELRPCEEVSSP